MLLLLCCFCLFAVDYAFAFVCPSDAAFAVAFDFLLFAFAAFVCCF